VSDALREILARLEAQPPDDVFHLYLDLVADAPDKAQVAALALRNQARSGALTAARVPLLAACLRAAPDAASLVHLAKALAAFGRKATGSSIDLVERLDPILVTTDCDYWVLDGCLWAMGYLGGEAARRFVEKLSVEKPSRAVRSQSVYEGRMSEAERAGRFAKTLAEVRALIESSDPGTWRSKRTDLEQQATKAKRGRRAPWTVR
jgi:hypothetical protein